MFTSCDLTNSEVSIIHECGLQRLIYEIMTHGESRIPHIHCWNRTLSIKSHTTASRFQSSRSFDNHIFSTWFRIIERARRYMGTNDSWPGGHARRNFRRNSQEYLSSDGWLTILQVSSELTPPRDPCCWILEDTFDISTTHKATRMVICNNGGRYKRQPAETELMITHSSMPQSAMQYKITFL
jgi:hypothetical protein